MNKLPERFPYGKIKPESRIGRVLKNVTCLPKFKKKSGGDVVYAARIKRLGNYRNTCYIVINTETYLINIEDFKCHEYSDFDGRGKLSPVMLFEGNYLYFKESQVNAVNNCTALVETHSLPKSEFERLYEPA